MFHWSRSRSRSRSRNILASLTILVLKYGGPLFVEALVCYSTLITFLNSALLFFYFFAVKCCYFTVCSILGMHLFGCKFCDPALIGTKACGRKNFDNLLWAIITVFQVPTFENFWTRKAGPKKPL